MGTHLSLRPEKFSEVMIDSQAQAPCKCCRIPKRSKPRRLPDATRPVLPVTKIPGMRHELGANNKTSQTRSQRNTFARAAARWKSASTTANCVFNYEGSATSGRGVLKKSIDRKLAQLLFFMDEFDRTKRYHIRSDYNSYE